MATTADGQRRGKADGTQVGVLIIRNGAMNTPAFSNPNPESKACGMRSNAALSGAKGKHE